MKIFVDMDGTIARFYEADDCLEKMYENGFFRGLRAYTKGVRLVKKFISAGYDVYILSACIGTQCENEKHAWLNKYLPQIDYKHRIFLPCGLNKAQYVINRGYADDRVNVLIDDYSRNLIEWQEAFGKRAITIKAVNEINNKNKSTNFDKYIKIA